MNGRDLEGTKTRPAGYQALIARFDLHVIPNWHRSFVASSGAHRIETTLGDARRDRPHPPLLSQIFSLSAIARFRLDDDQPQSQAYLRLQELDLVGTLLGEPSCPA